jgi:hypothetical protein
MGIPLISWIVIVVIATIPAAMEGVGGVGGVLVAAAIGLVFLAVTVRMNRRWKLGLPQIFLIAMTARFLVAVVVEHVIYSDALVGRPGLFAPDERWYLYEARILAEQIVGHAPSFNTDEYAIWDTSVARFAAYCFVAFGPVVLVPKLLISLLGAWTAVFSAIIGEEVLPGTGRRVGLLVAVFPSLILWSSMVLKDGPALFGVELILMAVTLKFGRSRISTVATAALVALGAAIIALTRSYEIVFVGAALVGALFLGKGRRVVRNFLIFVVLSLILVLIMQRSMSSPIDFTGDESPLARLAAIRTGFAEGAGSAVPHDIVDVRSPLGIALWLPIGLFFFFFAPIPFTGGSLISLATSPEMLVWYALMPSLWRGLRRAVNDNLAATAPLLLYLLVSSIGWSMLVTNVGTLYRYRTQVLFVPLLLIAYDQMLRAHRRTPVVASVLQTTSSTEAG